MSTKNGMRLVHPGEILREEIEVGEEIIECVTPVRFDTA